MEKPRFDIRTRRSSPIEIPQQRRRPSYSPPQYSPEQSHSPDMIFEMSPLTSNFPSSPSAFPQCSPRNSYDQEPFLYHFPAFSARNTNKSNRMHNAPIRRHEIPISHVFTPAKNALKRQRRAAEYAPDENVPVFSGGANVVRKTAATKIVGFSPGPLASCAQHNSKLISPPQERLLPMPQNTTFPWPPWILPGGDRGQYEEVAPCDVERITLRPENYLMGCTQDPDRFRFSNLQAVPSARHQ